MSFMRAPLDGLERDLTMHRHQSFRTVNVKRVCDLQFPPRLALVRLGSIEVDLGRSHEMLLRCCDCLSHLEVHLGEVCVLLDDRGLLLCTYHALLGALSVRVLLFRPRHDVLI